MGLIGGGGGLIAPPPLIGIPPTVAGGVGLLDAGEGGLLHHHAVRLRVGARGPARPGTGPAGLAGPARTAAARTACHASAHGTMCHDGTEKKKKKQPQEHTQ